MAVIIWGGVVVILGATLVFLLAVLGLRRRFLKGGRE